MGYSTHSKHRNIQNILMIVALGCFVADDVMLGMDVHAVVCTCVAIMMSVVTVLCWRQP